MKFFVAGVSLCFAVNAFAQQPGSFNDTARLEPVEVKAVNVSDKTPFAKTNLSREEIRQKNIGQDLPFILNETPSVVVNSDAGTGIGYTGIRIRGTDATRINVTLNGIPYNDPESLGSFFVDLPDIASSAGSIQVQRGVGTSANGAGSFGGSINISTNEVVKNQNFELNSTAGSYESFKNTLVFNSGIFKKHFTIDARMSNIRSEGYVDRAATRLKSYFLSTAYVGEKNLVRLNVFTGKEITYQSWYGINDITLDTNRRYNSAGTGKPGLPYDNETDNYRQTHYQLFYNHTFRPYLKSNVAVFLTRGKGYYEQYRAGETLTDYALPAAAVTESDLTRRLWLDNYFYGTIFSLQYEKQKTQLIFGGGINRFDNEHYGTIPLVKDAPTPPKAYRFYDNYAHKSDYSAYLKWTYAVVKNVRTFIDIQGRGIKYSIDGFRSNPSLIIDRNYGFFNPKAGITINKNNLKFYGSYARAVKEPNRDDFETAVNQLPSPEKLNDFETGVEYKKNSATAGVNFYYMNYRDQLVLTGKINDVGAYTRTNIPQSYRAGAEFYGAAKLSSVFTVSGNFTVSSNKVKDFTEYIDNYDAGGQTSKNYKKADISFSPNATGALTIGILPLKNTSIILTSKYVSDQFLDNTSNEKRKLDAYFTQDVRAGYVWKLKKIEEVNLYVQVNNVFSELYEPNGYTFSYIYGGATTTENYYFPMAPANFIIGLNIRLKKN